MTPYHHGSLRTALLAQARTVLSTDGPDAVTMRGLATALGVSHSAPARHFPDRDALLDAVVAQGFDELTAVLDDAEHHEDDGERLASYVHGHVRFAITNGALMDRMFSAHPRPVGSPGSQAAERFFARGRRLLGDDTQGAPGSLLYLLTATAEGIGSLAISGRLPRERVDGVVDLAVRLLLPAVREQLGRTG